MIKRFSVIVFLFVFVLNTGIFFLNPMLSLADYHKRGESVFIIHGSWQKVTMTTDPPPNYEIPITGYAVFEATGNNAINVCEGNTWNADAVFLIIPPGLPRITNVRNPLIHQEGVNIKAVEAISTTVTVETWAED